MDIVPEHEDGTPHVPDWTSLEYVRGLVGTVTFDVWCQVCGQSGSFVLDPAIIGPEIQWYP